MKIVTEHRPSSGLKMRRAALETRLAQLAGTFHDRSGLAVESTADMVDAVVMATDRDLLVRQMNLNGRMLDDVLLAIAALDRDEYGICEDCGEPIATRRLDAIPWARVCVKCQENRDLGTQHEDESFQVAA